MQCCSLGLDSCTLWFNEWCFHNISWWCEVYICHEIYVLLLGGPNQTNSKTQHYGDHKHSTHFKALLHRSLSWIFDSPDLGPLRDAMELLCWLFLRFFLPLPGAMWQLVLHTLVTHLVFCIGFCLGLSTWFAPGLSKIPCPTDGKLINWERGLFFCCLSRDVSSGIFWFFVWFHHLCSLLWPLCCHKS